MKKRKKSLLATYNEVKKHLIKNFKINNKYVSNVEDVVYIVYCLERRHDRLKKYRKAGWK